MGGGGSKNIKKEITFDYKPTKVPKIDQKFNEAQGLFRRAEEIRAALDDRRVKVLTLTKANYVKAADDVQFQEAIRIFFWGLSAEAGGNIAATGLKISNDFPYLELNVQGRSMQIVELYSHLSAYIMAVFNYSTAAADIKKKLAEVTTALTAFKKTYKAEAKAVPLTPKDTSAGQTALNQNLKKLTLETPKVNDLTNLGAKVGPIWKSTAPKLPELANTADVTGKRVAVELLSRTNPPSPPNLAEIFDKYYQGPKKTKEEVDWESNPKNKGKKPPAPKKGKTNTKSSTNKNTTTNPSSNTQANPTQTNQNIPPSNQAIPNQQSTNQIPTNQNPNTVPNNQVPNSNIINQPNTNPQQGSTTLPNTNPNFGGNLQQSNNMQNNQYSINSSGMINNPTTTQQQNQFGSSPFSNQGFATPSKKSNKEEDIFDEEDETRQPVVRNIHESNLLHQSSIKRQKYIKTNI